jgi:hypothetical protein
MALSGDAAAASSFMTKLADKQAETGMVDGATASVIGSGGEGGLQVRHDQLKELVKQQKVAAYEVIGRELVLYWRSLKGGERVEVPLSLTATVGGTFTAPASRAYLYYTDEHKHWTEPLAVSVAPR